MATIDFEFTKRGTGGSQTLGKFNYDVKAKNVTYVTLRDAEAAFLRWFRSFNYDDFLVDWKASIVNGPVLSKYSSALPYGFPKVDATQADATDVSTWGPSPSFYDQLRGTREAALADAQRKTALADARNEAAEAKVVANTERFGREAAEAKAADLQRQLQSLQAKQRRRWWPR